MNSKKNQFEKELAEILGSRVRDSVGVDQRIGLRIAFEKSIGNQFYLGKLILNFLVKGTDPYTTDNLHNRWVQTVEYSRITRLFLYYPATVSEIVEVLNLCIYSEVCLSWQVTQTIIIMDSHDDYYSKLLPGTSTKAQDVSLMGSKDLLRDLPEIKPQKLKELILEGYNRMLSKRWKVWGGSLFPIGYKRGDAGYGRLKTIPGSTVCNLKHEIKSIIGSVLKENFGFSIMEVDLKSCHAKIFETLFDWEQADRSLLPPLDSLWPTMVDQFRKVHKTLPETSITHCINLWGQQL